MEIIERKMNAAKDTMILSTHLFKSAAVLELGRDFIFQQDNDPKHTTKITMKWVKDNGISVLQWPVTQPKSYWKSVENFEVKGTSKDPKNIKELEKACKEEWLKLPASACKKRVGSYERV